MIVEGYIWKKSLRSKKAPLHELTSYVFHLVIRYNKYFYDKVVDMLTRPIFSALVFFKHNSIMHKSYLEQYVLDDDGKDVYATLCCTNQVEELDSYVHGKLWYLGKLCFS
jgi:CRISPR/Cas system-associated endonuclease Cas3-HD